MNADRVISFMLRFSMNDGVFILYCSLVLFSAVYMRVCFSSFLYVGITSWRTEIYILLFTTASIVVLSNNNNNNNNNNNKHDNVYGAVIIAEPLREFTRFI